MEREKTIIIFFHKLVLICKTLSPFYLRMLYAKFGLNWPISFGKIFFLYISSLYVRYFVSILPLKKDMALPLIKLESPLPKDALCQVWLKLASWFQGIFFLNSFNVFTLFPTYLPLVKGVTLHFNKFESSLPKEALCKVWLKLTQWIYRFLISSM